jgi:hypothetical protein
MWCQMKYRSMIMSDKLRWILEKVDMVYFKAASSHFYVRTEDNHPSVSIANYYLRVELVISQT